MGVLARGLANFLLLYRLTESNLACQDRTLVRGAPFRVDFPNLAGLLDDGDRRRLEGLVRLLIVQVAVYIHLFVLRVFRLLQGLSPWDISCPIRVGLRAECFWCRLSYLELFQLQEIILSTCFPLLPGLLNGSCLVNRDVYNLDVHFFLLVRDLTVLGVDVDVVSQHHVSMEGPVVLREFLAPLVLSSIAEVELPLAPEHGLLPVVVELVQSLDVCRLRFRKVLAL
jgi:hypothetical protein